MLLVTVGKTGAEKKWGKTSIPDTDAQVRAVLPVAAQAVVFAGYSKSSAGTWRAWYGRWDTGSAALDGSMTKVGDFSNHRLAAAITKVGSRAVIAGWKRKKGGNKSGWIRSFGASKLDQPKDYEFAAGKKEGGFDGIATMHDNGLLLAGWTSDSQYGGTDAWIVRTTAAFKHAWTTRLGTDADDHAFGVVPYGAGSVIVGRSGVKSSSVAEATLWRLDPYGNTWWHRTYNSSGGRHLTGVMNNGTAGFFIAGFEVAPTKAMLAIRTDAFGHATCTASGVCADKTEKSCADNKACTGDSCHPAKGCAYSKLPKGKKCGANKQCQTNNDCF